MGFFNSKFLEFWKDGGTLILFWLPFVVVYPQTFRAEIPYSFYLFVFPAAIAFVASFKLDDQTKPYLGGILIYVTVYIYYLIKTPGSFKSFELWTILLLIGIMALILAFLGAKDVMKSQKSKD